MADEKDNNPYQVPGVEVLAQGTNSSFSDMPRSVPAGNGLQWIRDGWALFKQAPGQMVLLVFLYLIINMVTGFIPLVNFVSPLINMVFLGGAFIAIRRLDAEGELRVDDLFAAFKTHLTPLVLLGLLMLGVGIIIIAAVAMVGFGAVMGSDGNPGETSAILFGLLVALAMGLFFMLYFTVFYAVLLVVLGNQPLASALSNAFSAFVKNWLPFLVNGLIALLITTIAMIPLFLGLLISTPLLFASMYCSYKDIFAAE